MRPGDGQIAGAGEEIEAGDDEILRIFDLLAAELSTRTATELTAKIVGVSKNRVYTLARSRPQ